VSYKRCAWRTPPLLSQVLDVLQSSHPDAIVTQRLPPRTQHVQPPRPALVVDVLNRAATVTPLLRILTVFVQLGTCVSTANARLLFPPDATATQRPLLKTRLAPTQKPVSGVAASNRAVTATPPRTTQIACALLETSVLIANVNPPFPLAVTVIQRLPTPTRSVRTASFASVASAKRALNPPKADSGNPPIVLSTPRSSLSSTPPSPSSQTRTPSST